MDVEEFKKKYEQLKDNPMYKNFCSILDTKNQVLERIAKENQELKKKLEQCSAVADTNSELADSIDEHYKKQQKEFIEWLEKEIKETREKWGNALTNESLLDVAMTVAAYEEILSKYKEIIGVKDE